MQVGCSQGGRFITLVYSEVLYYVLKLCLQVAGTTSKENAFNIRETINTGLQPCWNIQGLLG